MSATAALTASTSSAQGASTRATHSLPLQNGAGHHAPPSATQHDPSLAGHDEEQIRLMEERCIVVDPNDAYLRDGSKKECHLMTNIQQGLLHRAFSCFLFHPHTGKLLMQRRATEKITFPNMWTNTCCSHPLAIKAELDETDHVGARRAAQRKLQHELGIPPEQVPLDEFQFLTRIHYLAPSDGLWGEHEIDYILFITAEVTLEPNDNEVCDTRWVDQAELKSMMHELDADSFTPWFKLIAARFLFPWWSKLLERRGSGVSSTASTGTTAAAATKSTAGTESTSGATEQRPPPPQGGTSSSRLDATSLAHLRDGEIHRML